MTIDIVSVMSNERGQKYNSVFLHEYWDGVNFKEVIDSAAVMAEHSRTGRYNFMIHKAFEEDLQCLINAVHTVSYVQPHKHSNTEDRRETFTVARGHFWVIEFNDKGVITKKVKLDANGQPSQRTYVIETGVFHTVVSDGPFVTLELKQHPVGGYDATTDKVFATDWSPGEKDSGAQEYNQFLLQKVLNS